MDIFSRKIVGWQTYEMESSELASEVMRDICVRENIAPHQVVLHSDNGGPMKGATMLGVAMLNWLTRSVRNIKSDSILVSRSQILKKWWIKAQKNIRRLTGELVFTCGLYRF
jgi:hypothetical protein